MGSCIRGYNQKRIEISLGPIEYRENLGRQRRNSLGRASLTKMSYGMLDQARIEAAEKEAEQATDIAGRLAPWLPLWADGDEETRSAALSALAVSRSRGDAVTKVFVEAACDPLPAARCQAMWWFSDEEDRGVGTAAFEALTAGLRDVDACVRAAAAQGLRFSDPVAIEPLLVALRDTDADVRSNVVIALKDFDLPVPSVVEALIRVFHHDPDLEVRENALHALAYLDATQALDVLRSAARAEDLRLRLAAALALGDSRSLPEVHRLELVSLMLRDSDEEVRERAVRSLAPLFDEQPGAASLPLLAAIGDGEAIEPLIRTLDRREPYVRRRIVWALSFFTSTRVMPVLTGSLSDPAPDVACTAAKALLETLTPAQVRALLSRVPLLRRLPAPARELLRREREYELEEGDGSSGPRCQRLVRLGATEYE